MIKFFVQLFQATPVQVAQQRLFSARREFVSHTCQARYHGAMASMNSDIIAELERMLGEGDHQNSRAGDRIESGAAQFTPAEIRAMRPTGPVTLADYISKVELEEGMRK